MKTKVLSRFISRVVVLVLVLGLLAGCGGPAQPTATTVAPTTVAPTTAAPTTAAPTTAAPTTAAPIAAGEVIKWRWQSTGVPGTSTYWLLEDLVASIKEASSGRMEIQLLPVGAVIGTMESFDAVSKGVVEMASS